eukprot:c36779_g1_i1 orf=38-238(+)
MDENDGVIVIDRSFFGVLMHKESHLNDDGMHENVVDVLSMACESECVEEDVCMNGSSDSLEDAYGC